MRAGLFCGARPRLTVGVTSLFFVLMEVRHFRQFTRQRFSGVIKIGLVMGLGCCWLVWRTGSIKSEIALHAFYNLLITLDVYLLYQMPN